MRDSEEKLAGLFTAKSITRLEAKEFPVSKVHNSNTSKSTVSFHHKALSLSVSRSVSHPGFCAEKKRGKKYSQHRTEQAYTQEEPDSLTALVRQSGIN